MIKRKKISSTGSLTHPNLVPRIEEFLRTRPTFKASSASVVEYLMSRFNDYQRLGSNKLALLVNNYLDSSTYKRARDGFLAKKEGKGDGVSSSGSDSESEVTGLVEMPDTNALNSSLRATYVKVSPASPSPSVSSSVAASSAAASSSTSGTKPSSGTTTPRSKKRSRDEVLPAPPREDSLAQKKCRPTARYADFGGIENILQDVRELIERPLTHPEIFEWLGTQMPRGVLLHGPPGCGKTQLAYAIAGELGVSFLQIAAPEVVSGMSGESEAKIRQLFQDAKARAPSIIFIDEIDAITPKRETAAREMERRIVAQLLTCMDELEGGVPVMVIGATNRPDALDQALRRSGRFDREICLNVPDQPARARILKVICSKLRLSGDFDFDLIASNTPGYVGADLQAIAKEAASIAVNRIFSTLEASSAFAVPQTQSEESENESLQQDYEATTQTKTFGGLDSSAQDSSSMEVDGGHFEENGSTHSSHHHHHHEKDHTEGDDQTQHSSASAADHHHLDARMQVSNYLRANVDPFTPDQLEPLSISMDDFLEAIKRVQPSAKREGFATIPNVTWDDIGALTGIRKELEMALLEPIRSKNAYEALNIPVSLGVLLYGPPGCGKTLLAKAIANQAQANFISIKGPELLNKFVGESERSVRVVFQRARASSPCIIFFDEVDALVPKRVGGENAVTDRVVNQLLTELDGLDKRDGISVVAATNRPDIIDSAMLRPGRLDKLLYVPLPSPDERIHILKTCARKTPLSQDVDLERIARDSKLNGYSGADIAALVREASMNALATLLAKGDRKTIPFVSDFDFQIALRKVAPSVSKADQIRYEKLRTKLSSPHLIADNDDDTAAPSSSAPTTV